MRVFMQVRVFIISILLLYQMAILAQDISIDASDSNTLVNMIEMRSNSGDKIHLINILYKGDLDSVTVNSNYWILYIVVPDDISEKYTNSTSASNIKELNTSFIRHLKDISIWSSLYSHSIGNTNRGMLNEWVTRGVSVASVSTYVDNFAPFARTFDIRYPCN